MLTNNLKKLRLKHSMTQIQIADKLNIHEHTYKRYEYNKRIPKVDIALEMAKVLNTTVEELFPLNTKLKNNKQLNNNTKGE